MWDVPFTMYEHTAKVAWVAEMAFLITGCCIKVSVLLFYRRLVVNTVTRYWVGAVMVAIAFTVAYTLAFVLTLIFNCTPTEAYWKSFSPTYTRKYHCVDTTIVNLLAGIAAVTSDLYSVVLPCAMTRNLQIPRLQKVALYVIFSLGLLAVAASCVRTYYLYEVGHSSDVTTKISDVFASSQLELSLGMMCAALPLLRVLFREFLSAPLSRFKRTLTSDPSYRLSDVAEQAVIPLADSGEPHHTSENCGKHSHNVSIASSVVTVLDDTKSEMDREEIQTHVTKKKSLVTTPAEYESFNLQNMEQYRLTVNAARAL